MQMGVGTVSAALGMYLDDKQDLGVQTELITGGIVDLVERGVVTGNRKTIHRARSSAARSSPCRRTRWPGSTATRCSSCTTSATPTTCAA